MFKENMLHLFIFSLSTSFDALFYFYGSGGIAVFLIIGESVCWVDCR